MRISPYQVTFLNTPIDGAMIENRGGYAVLQPWVPLGDSSLAEIFSLYKNGQTHPLLSRALHIAEHDGMARKEHRQLFPELSPASHSLLNLFDPDVAGYMGLLIEEGQTLFKFKVGRNLEDEKNKLFELDQEFSHVAWKLRLDANLRCSHADLDHCFSEFSDSILNRIDFIEDPFVGDPEDWMEFRERWDIRVAHDFASAELRQAADVWILKPTRFEVDKLVKEATANLKRIVITTALDHPFGHVVAAATAADIASEDPLLLDACGLLSFNEIVHPWSNKFRRDGSSLDLHALEGTGYGFDTELKKLEWTSV